MEATGRLQPLQLEGLALDVPARAVGEQCNEVAAHVMAGVGNRGASPAAAARGSKK